MNARNNSSLDLKSNGQATLSWWIIFNLSCLVMLSILPSALNANGPGASGGGGGNNEASVEKITLESQFFASSQIATTIFPPFFTTILAWYKAESLSPAY